MKRFASVLLAVVLMLSLSVFSFADYNPFLLTGAGPFPDDIIIPYSLIPDTNTIIGVTSRDGSSFTYSEASTNSDGLFVGSNLILSFVESQSGTYTNSFYIGKNTKLPTNSKPYWFNFIGRITDANGYVLQPSDFNYFGVYLGYDSSFSYNLGGVAPSLGSNIYGYSDGFFQLAMSSNTSLPVSFPKTFIYFNVSNSSVVAPLSYEVQDFELYSNESSVSVPPFTFGDGAHIPDVPTPKDPNDHTQYGSASDQVEWFNDAFGGAVDPDLDEKIVTGTDMLLQQEEIEQDVIADFQQYSSQVDPANITFPTAVLNGMSFIGTTFMSSYNNLGDISFVISLSMMIGVVLVLIGRGEGALARGMSASSRERRRTEYASERDMKKGG